MEEYKTYDEYKSVNLEWIDKIPSHWNKMKISHYFKIGRGRVISKGEIADNKGKYPVYSSQTGKDGILGYIDTYDFHGDYITWTTDGANAGTVFRRTGKFNCTNVCGTLKKLKEVNLTYSKYCLSVVTKKHVRKDINPKLMNNTMAEIRILKPSIKEQKKIATFLDKKTAEINKIINKKENLIEKLKEYKKTVITEAVTKGKLGDNYINEDGELVDEIEMKDSNNDYYDKIPHYAKSIKMKFITKKIIDGTHTTPEYVDNGVPFLRVTDITGSNTIDWSEARKISKNEHKKLKTRTNPQKGDLLVSKNGTIGETKVITWKKEFSIFVSLCLIKFNESINPFYISYFFKSFALDEQIRLLGKTNTVTNLHLEKIRELELLLIDSELQIKIVNYLNKKGKKIDNLIKLTKESIKKYKEYKKALIFEAVTGKIDLRDYEVEEGEESVKHNNTRETERKSLSTVN